MSLVVVWISVTESVEAVDNLKVLGGFVALCYETDRAQGRYTRQDVKRDAEYARTRTLQAPTEIELRVRRWSQGRLLTYCNRPVSSSRSDAARLNSSKSSSRVSDS